MYTILYSCTLFYIPVHYSMLLYSILYFCTLFYTPVHYSILLYFILYLCTLLYTAVLYSIIWSPCTLYLIHSPPRYDAHNLMILSHALIFHFFWKVLKSNLITEVFFIFNSRILLLQRFIFNSFKMAFFIISMYDEKGLISEINNGTGQRAPVRCFHFYL